MATLHEKMYDMFDVALMTCPKDFGEGFHCFLKKLLIELKKTGTGSKVLADLNQASSIDMTSVLLDSPALRPLLTLPEESYTYDDGAAEALRESGNAYFKRSRFEEALKAYNTSIIFCRREPSADRSISGCLPLSYANRSAVLYQTNELRGCVMDIDAAIEAAYPVNMVHKLHERKARCLLRLRNYSAAADAVAAARESLSAATVTEEEKQVLSRLLDDHAHACAAAAAETAVTATLADDTAAATACSNVPSGTSYPGAPPLAHGANDMYTALSAAVNVVENDCYGKHVVCKQRIEVGDVVAVEEPLVAVPLPTSLTTHCYFCLQRYGVAFYPCRRCSVALYCSQECETRSWLSYHRYECYKMLALTGCGHHLGHLSLRATLVAGLAHHFSHDGASIVTADQSSAASPGCSLCPRGYSYILRQGIPKEAFNPVNIVCLSILAVYLALCTNPAVVELIPSSGKSGKSFLHDVAAVTFTHLTAFTNRTHHIYETITDSVSCDAAHTAWAIYPLVNLFNHSCDASVYRTYHGRKMVMRSVCTILPGDQVFDMYGASYMYMNREERLSYLKSYCFDCKCAACVGDWPSKAVLSRQAEIKPLPPCVHKNLWSAGQLQCLPCLVRLSALASMLYKFEIGPDSARDQGLVKTLIGALGELHRIALQPHFLFVDCKEKLRFCFDVMGNSRSVAPREKENVLTLVASKCST